MIGKIIQGKGFRGAINYVLEKQDARLLYSEGVRLKDKASIARSFITQSKLKPNVSKPVAHISLDFSVQDKARLTDKLMIEVAREYLGKMGYENTQYIIARHYDTEHPHVHLIVNRIDNDGNRIADQNEKLRNVRLCMDLTRKYGLYIAPGKENVKEHRLKGPDKTKYEIYNALRSTLSSCRNWNELRFKLQKLGIGVEFRRNGSTDKIQGVRFSKDGHVFIGSKVDRNFSYTKISSQLQQNEQLNQQNASLNFRSMGAETLLNTSSFQTAASAFGQLFSILRIPAGNSGEDLDRQREEVQKRRRRKGRRL